MILLCVAAGTVSLADAIGERKFGPDDVNTTVDMEAGKATIVSFTKLGVVDLLTISFALSDTSEGSTDNATIENYLVNGTPTAVPVEKTAAAKINIKGDPRYSKFITVTPNIMLSTAGAEFEKVQPFEVDDSRYYFLFALRDGCEECSIVGYARIAFDFDKDGKFKEATLIKLMKTRQRL
ncbi:MAG: hypothetical protein HQL01_11095 [Nitrospirae bacterium]|nr:hypothetical protein [Nitrospirota bacterium]